MGEAEDPWSGETSVVLRTPCQSGIQSSRPEVFPDVENVVPSV